MITTKKIDVLSEDTLEEIGFSWSDTPCVKDELVEVSQEEAKAFADATNELYDMFVEAAENVIENDLFFELGIPFNLVETIKKSWENDVHWHIYGRFDFAGGIDGKAIKLLGFNADSADRVFETAILQWAMIKENNMDEDMQFNAVYESISSNFKRLITLFEDTDKFEELYDGWKILFSCEEGETNKEVTTKLLRDMAEEAGFETNFAFLGDVEFDENSICDKDSLEYEYWFKMYEWTEISIQEGELALTLQNILNNQAAIILNPAYTLLFQSRAMMKILKDMYPDSPYLLETTYESLENKPCIEQKVFSGDGENVKFLHVDNTVEFETDGSYDHYKSVYQEQADNVEDESKNIYRASVFFAYEACGLSFTRDEKIINKNSEFVGHFIT